MNLEPHRILFIDGSQGAAGDMILGALIDVGVPFAPLRRVLQSLPLEGWSIRSRPLSRCGLAARKIDVRVRGPQPARGFRALRRVVAGSALEPAVRERALAIFEKLVRAEARVHGRPFDKVHLHEAGGADAIVDVVGAAWAIEHLAPARIVVSPLTTGFGNVRCDHGVYPVPAPATLELLRDVPARAGDIESERLTPTGAAILVTVADAWGEMPPLRPDRIGYGAGDRDLSPAPNMLRMVVGDAGALAADEEVVVLECTLDDATPQAVAHAAAELLAAGALDVHTTAIGMKKGRPGVMLTILAPKTESSELARGLLAHTTTLGVRMRSERRLVLERKTVRVSTPYGSVRVKVALDAPGGTRAWPEYEDCASLARKKRVPLLEVQQAALAAWRRR